jgi:hypothetical protein
VLVVVADGGQKLGDMVVVQAVAHSAPVPVSDHEPELPKHPQLLRDGTRLHLHLGGQLVDVELPIEQRIEQPNTALCPEDAHRLRDPRRLLGPERAVGRTVFERVGHGRLGSISEQMSRRSAIIRPPADAR